MFIGNLSQPSCSLFFTGTSILAVLLAGYFAQKYLPPPKPKIVGIDLGYISVIFLDLVVEMIINMIKALQKMNNFSFSMQFTYI